jgi:hypothetical protein
MPDEAPVTTITRSATIVSRAGARSRRITRAGVSGLWYAKRTIAVVAKCC